MADLDYHPFYLFWSPFKRQEDKGDMLRFVILILQIILAILVYLASTLK